MQVPVYLLPLVVRFLTDTNNQVCLFLVILNCCRCNTMLNKVRKTSQAALLVLLEQGLADTRDVEEQVKRVARE